MTTDNKTLADAQPGGRVRLPQAGQFDSELLWWLMDAASTLSEGGNESHAERLRSLHAALSAQPSPGGQDALLESLVARWRNHAEEIGVSDNLLCQKIANCTMRHAAELQAVLAARQPVGEPVAWKYQDKAADGVWEDRISERLPCWEHRNPIPLYAVPPAQAMGLGQFRKAVEAWKRDAENKHRAGDIFAEQKDAIWKEADRLLALIDSSPSQALDPGLQLDRYDAGLLGDGGGGDVGWWQDYIRAELDRAHEFYQDQADAHG